MRWNFSVSMYAFWWIKLEWKASEVFQHLTKNEVTRLILFLYFKIKKNKLY